MASVEGSYQQQQSRGVPPVSRDRTPSSSSQLAQLCICQLCTCGEHRCRSESFKTAKEEPNEVVAANRQLAWTFETMSDSGSGSNSSSASCTSSTESLHRGQQQQNRQRQQQQLLDSASPVNSNRCRRTTPAGAQAGEKEAIKSQDQVSQGSTPGGHDHHRRRATPGGNIPAAVAATPTADARSIVGSSITPDGTMAATNRDRVLDVRNLKNSPVETHLTFPGENRRLPLKRKVKNNPNLIDHIQENDIINESHRQQKRHPQEGGVTADQWTLDQQQQQQQTPKQTTTTQDAYQPRQLQPKQQQQPVRLSRQEADIRRNTFRSDEYAVDNSQYRSKSTVASTRRPTESSEDREKQTSSNSQNYVTLLAAKSGRGPQQQQHGRAVDKFALSSDDENRNKTMAMEATTKLARDKLYKTCQQQHFSIFDNDYPKPKDFDGDTQTDYKRWPSRNGKRRESPTKLAFIDQNRESVQIGGTGGEALNLHKNQRIKSYNDLFRESPDSMFTFGDRCNYRTSYKSLCRGDDSKCPVLKLADGFDYIGENCGHTFYAKK